MEKKKLKKLVLKKETISTLNEASMDQLKGGGLTDLCKTIYENLLCTAGCGNTGTCNCGGGGSGTNNGGSGYAVCCGYGGGYVGGGGWTPITVTGYCW